MKIVWIKLLELLATNVLPVAVELLIDFVKTKVKSYEKATTIGV